MFDTFRRLRFAFPAADSITLSGDERELGKVCVRVSYQEAAEQVWITLVQVRLHTCRKLLCAAPQWLLCPSSTPASVLASRRSASVGLKKVWWETIF